MRSPLPPASPDAGSLAGVRVLVVGLGHFGGGTGVTRWLAAQGATLRVTDLKPAEQLTRPLAELAELALDYRLGGHDAADLDWAELVVASPAVPRDRGFLADARARGLPLSSEMTLFLERCPGRLIGVTGSNGKSTTTTLLAGILEAAGQTVHLGGNLGRSLLGELERIAADDAVVLELSSFQLEDVAARPPAADVAVLTNLSPNHLDRHGTFGAYCEAKSALFRGQTADAVKILNRLDPASRPAQAWGPARAIWTDTTAVPPGGLGVREGWLIDDRAGDGQPLVAATDVRLPGVHNQANLLAAAAAALSAGATPASVAQVARTFAGLPHRLEDVGDDGRRRFYNDSIATTPESTIAALRAFAGSPRHVLVGGYDKGGPLDALAAALRAEATTVVLIGALGERLAGLLKGAPRVERAAGFDAGVERLLALAEDGVVLMSPAAASYDEFANFTERGDRFRARINALVADA